MSASINGIQLGPDSGAAWSLQAGTSPYVATLRMDTKTADAMIQQYGHEESSITIGGKTFSKLTALGTSPIDTPHEEAVAVADRRWAWPRVHLKRSYNVRRKTGKTRNVGAGENVANLQQDEDFIEWTLNNGRPWTAREVLRDVIRVVLIRSASEENYQSANLEIPSGEGWPVIEGLEIDSPGDVAIGRVLSEIGGTHSLYIDAEGNCIVYDLTDGSEAGLLGIRTGTRERGASNKGLPMVVGFPVYAMSDRSMERPSSVYVSFSVAAELRFDADETGTPANKATKTKGGPQELRSMNVVAIPEDATIGGEELKVGSWVPLTDYLDYLSGQSTPGGLPNISYSILNKAWLHSALEVYGILDPSGLWARRIAAIRSAYRRVYRIERPYSENSRAFFARRVKLQDTETDGYLASPTYFDYSAWVTWRGVDAHKASAGPTAQETVRNRFAADPGPNGIIGTSIDDLSEAPANVSMIDPTLGIFSVDFFPSISARAANYLHSALITTPSGDPTEADATWLQDGELYHSREFSAILSTTPEAPNNVWQFYSMHVEPRDCGGAIAQQSPGRGPVYHIRVDPGVALARMEWDDARAEEIKQWFAGEGLDAEEAYGDPINLPELKAVAVLKAREIYSRFVDSYEGGITTGQRDVPLQGSAKSIKHEASSAGILTSVSMPEGRPAIDLSQYMPASVRKLIDRDGEA